MKLGTFQWLHPHRKVTLAPESPSVPTATQVGTSPFPCWNLCVQQLCRVGKMASHCLLACPLALTLFPLGMILSEPQQGEIEVEVPFTAEYLQPRGLPFN